MTSAWKLLIHGAGDEVRHSTGGDRLVALVIELEPRHPLACLKKKEEWKKGAQYQICKNPEVTTENGSEQKQIAQMTIHHVM